MTVEEVKYWASHIINFDEGHNLKTKLETEIFNKNFDRNKFSLKIVSDHGLQVIKTLESSKKKYHNIMDSLMDTIEDAWDRVKYYAKQELYDKNEDDYDDEDDVSDYDIDQEFDENYFIDFFQQELKHNVIGQTKFWDKYIPDDIDFRKWNNNYNSLDDYIDSTVIQPIRDEINNAYKVMLYLVNSAIKEFNNNKGNMIKYIFDEDRTDWDYS